MSLPLPEPFTHFSFAGLIGVAREDITPPVGIYSRNWGAALHDVANGIHRPLTLTALSLQTEKDAPPLVLMTADLGWWRGRENEWFVRSWMLEQLQLDPARLMFNLTHTHAGPSLIDQLDLPGAALIPGFIERVREAGVRAAQGALLKRKPAVLSWHYGQCGLAQNRDLQDPGKDRLVCGFNPSGKPDQTLLVGRVTGERGEILATLANYACHPVTLAWENHLLSPDYVGAMREVVEAGTQGAPCLFLQGASGELAPRDEYVGEVAIAESNGRQLGHAVLSTLEGMLPHRARLSYSGVVESGAPLAIWKREPDAPSTTLAASQIEIEFELQELASLAELEQRLRECQERALAERIRRKLALRKDMGAGRTARMPLWVWRVGDAVLVGQPNEAYSDFQVALRGRVAPRAVAVMNLVNGGYGYLPPRPLFERDAYQVWQSPFAAGSLERLTEACAKAIDRLLV